MMLTPMQLERLPVRMIQLYGEVEGQIIADMARKIAAYGDFIPAAQWQYRKLEDMGLLRGEILDRLSGALRLTRGELRRLMIDAGAKALTSDDRIYRAAGLNPSPADASPALQRVLGVGYQRTAGLFDNLTRTTATTATRQFERELDNAYMRVTTGAFSPTQAIREAVRSLAARGVEAVAYPGGRVDHLDVAVRRAVVTGVNQTALLLQVTRADEMGCDLVETSAHGGARPSHQEWQGRIFSRAGGPDYPDFVRSTGYGSGAGLGGWNCRHSFHPYFEGLGSPNYTAPEREGLAEKTVTFDGNAMGLYEATQRQRAIERQIRRWRRECLGLEAAGMDKAQAAARLARWRSVERDFLAQTGLRRQTERSRI